MQQAYRDFATALKTTLCQDRPPSAQDTAVAQVADNNVVYTLDNNGEQVGLQLIPPVLKTEPADAAVYFSGIEDVAALLTAYQDAALSKPFETSLFPPDYLSNHAHGFIAAILSGAKARIDATDARLIADFVRHLDVYTAVKAVESLLYNHADLALLRVAQARGWQLHFDHLAIRCGSQSRQAAEKVVALLVKEHGYVPSQIASEAFYPFPDGWNAYPVYKMLENGQFLRLFIDQSDATAPQQIIQHWNHVYGFTAHHLGLRATCDSQGERRALELSEIEAELTPQGVGLLTPTGMYTEGLLQQVFTRPQREDQLPEALLQAIRAVDPKLVKVIGNAKLLEIVSRRELPTALKKPYFALYDITYQPDQPLHSAPVYQYFLPAQAAHVIRTSVQIESVKV